MGVVLLGGSDDRVGRLLDPQVDHLVAIVGQDDVHQVLADIVDVAFHRGQHKSPLLRTFFLFHFGFKIGNCLLHHASRIQHGRQLHLARAK